MTEGERIRYLRKGVLKKTLEEFGQVIGLGKGAMSAMETASAVSPTRPLNPSAASLASRRPGSAPVRATCLSKRP